MFESRFKRAAEEKEIRTINGKRIYSVRSAKFGHLRVDFFSAKVVSFVHRNNFEVLNSFRACYVYLQADQKLYQHVYEKEGNMDDVRHVWIYIFW